MKNLLFTIQFEEDTYFSHMMATQTEPINTVKTGCKSGMLAFLMDMMEEISLYTLQYRDFS